MPKSNYIQQSDPAFAAQLTGFKNAIGGYSSVLGLTSGPLTEQAADADYFAYTVAATIVMQHSASQWAAWKGLARHGDESLLSAPPSAPVMPAAVPAVAVGIEGRFRALVRNIKTNPAYNEAMGKALGIEGAQQSGPDLNTIAPVLTAVLTGGRVHIGWGWQGYGSQLDLIEILVNRGAGFVPLAYDTTPGYDDTTPFPATPAKWTYKATYRKGDHAVGQWSNEVSVTVGG